MANLSALTFAANPFTERGTAGKLDVSDDGQWMCYASGKAVLLRDMRSPAICDAYVEHARNVNVARFAPGGQYVASGDAGGAVRVWSSTHAEKLLKKETPVLGGPILDLAWDHEGKRLIAGGDGGKGAQAKAFNAETGSALGEITGHQKPVVTVAMRPTKPSTCATGSQDFKVGFFKGPPYKFVMSAGEHSNFVQCVRYSPNGQLLCSVGSDKQIFLFDAESGASKGSLAGEKEHGGSIYGCSFSPDSKQLLTVSGDKTAKLWDVERSTVVSTFELGSNTEDMQVACAWVAGFSSPVSLALGGDINVLDLGAGKASSQIKSFVGEPTSLACDSRKSKGLYVGDNTGVVTSFTFDGLGDHVRGRGHEGNVCGVVVSAGGKAASAGYDDTVRWIEGSEFKGGVAALGGQPTGLASTPDSEMVAFVTEKKAGVAVGGRVVGSVALDFEGCAVGISPKGDKLLVGDKEKKNVRVFDVAEGGAKVTATSVVLPDLLAPANVIVFSPDGKFVAVGDRLKEVSLWNGANFEPVVRQKWVFHTSVINALAWSPDSAYIASGSVDSQVYIWNPAAPSKKTKIAFAHKGGVTGVDWASTTEIFSCGGDRCVRKWVPELPKA